jgi:hypothetical protein
MKPQKKTRAANPGDYKNSLPPKYPKQADTLQPVAYFARLALQQLRAGLQ